MKAAVTMKNTTKRFMRVGQERVMVADMSIGCNRRMSDKTIKRMEWEATVKAVGHTGMITVPVSLLGKRVKVVLEVVE